MDFQGKRFGRDYVGGKKSTPSQMTVPTAGVSGWWGCGFCAEHAAGRWGGGHSDSFFQSCQNSKLNLRSQPAAWLLERLLYFNTKQQMEMLRGSGLPQVVRLFLSEWTGENAGPPCPPAHSRHVLPKAGRTGQPLGQ